MSRGDARPGSADVQSFRELDEFHTRGIDSAKEHGYL
jgi:hypothetical protein